MSRRVIRGGRVIDPASGVEASRDLLLADGRVEALEVPGAFDRLPDAEFVDAAGLVVAPGLIDLHVHLREPGQTWKETIRSGTAAAAAGGFTTVVAMPNTTPVNDTPERLAWMLAAERGTAVRLLAMPAATIGSLGEQLTDFAALARAGAAGFTDDGRPILGSETMRAALVAAAHLNLPISQHAEDTGVTRGASMNAGALSFRLGLRGMPVEAESSIVERDLELLRVIEREDHLRPHLHVQHVSTARALAAIREAKRQGLHVTCEAAPHHFALNEEAVGDYETHAKMNPPLRVESDRLAVIDGLLDGTIDCIATDHAPHAQFEKEVEFERAPNGIVGLETALGLALRVLHGEHGLAISRVLHLMTWGPAQILGGDSKSAPAIGSLKRGAPADLVLFDAAAAWNYNGRDSKSKSRNTPFSGAAMLGRVAITICAGQVVYRSDDELRSEHLS